MKKIKLLLFAVIGFTGMHVHAQTLDEIVNKNTEAMGGKEKLASLKTVKMTGNMSVQGTDISITMTKTHLIGMRTDIEVMNTANYQIVNQTKGWIFMPVAGMDAPKEMTEDEFKVYSNQTDIQGVLFNYKDKGSTVELVGPEKVDGADAYNIKVTFKNGRVNNYFVDKTTSRIIKVTGKATIQGQETDIATSFSDYKQNADGHWFPYMITNMQGPITIDKIETNVAVDEKIYSN